MIQRIKRYVTGHDAEGRSIILFDDDAPNALEIGGGLGVTELWVTNEIPIINTGAQDSGARPIQHDPGPGGTIFRVVEIPPDTSTDMKSDAAALMKAIKSGYQQTSEDIDKHPTMHKTDTIDYLVVISGEMYMAMDKGEVLLKPGDCIVQRGTKHAWINRGDKPCLLAAILIDAVPVG